MKFKGMFVLFIILLLLLAFGCKKNDQQEVESNISKVEEIDKNASIGEIPSEQEISENESSETEVQVLPEDQIIDIGTSQNVNDSQENATLNQTEGNWT